MQVIHRNQGLHLQLNESPGKMLWNAISCSVRTLTAMWLNTFPFTRLQKAHLHAALLALTYPHVVQVLSPDSVSQLQMSASLVENVAICLTHYPFVLLLDLAQGLGCRSSTLQ